MNPLERQGELRPTRVMMHDDLDAIVVSQPIHKSTDLRRVAVRHESDHDGAGQDNSPVASRIRW